MTASGPALIAAAAGVGFGHAVLPDHWVPLALLGRTRRYPVARIARLAGLAGLAHVAVSILLGGLIIVVGLRFRSAVQSAQDVIVGALLITTGAGFLLLELRGAGRHRHEHAHPPGSPNHLRGLVAAVMVPFGAAASPDLTILPVFLAAATVGAATAMASLVVFAVVTVGTIVGLTLVAARGGYEVRGRWLERWGNGLTALVLVLIGLLVLTGLI